MTCFYPLKGWFLPDRKQPKVTSSKVHHIEWNGKTAFEVLDETVLGYKPIYNYIDIPCGRCEGCRLDVSSQWADRCVLEAKEWEHKECLTLTYDEEHVKKNIKINPKTGEVSEIDTLYYKDYQDFIKRLRISLKRGLRDKNGKLLTEPQQEQPKIKMIVAGEYGDKKKRPHFHAIIYGLNVPDKELWKKSKSGYDMHRSQCIEKIWGNGLVTIEPVNYETAAYIARYIQKKVKGKDADAYYENKGIVPEMLKMSTKEAIAKNFYKERRNTLYETQKIWIPTKKTLKKARIPRYYDKQLQKENPELFEKIKAERRELQKSRERTEMSKTNLSLEEYREAKRRKTLEKLNKLKRNYESGPN
ncbi:replication initiator protein [Sigmofec virus UA08Rod_6125]|uniref:Replication initiator protein n=1 Tax=Sigmofec virus UA08Rod_6125 TaxID=2929454 RepID=A0A976N128_9VIRU|nr:replication initiator protein [Sigmofec virus UA08Rod_6125]